MKTVSQTSRNTVTIAALLIAALMSHQSLAETTDEAQLAERTLAWISSWRTTPEQPFDIEKAAYLYAQNGPFSTFDFGRPHDGFRDWQSAKDYYTKFMKAPSHWRLEANDDMNITIRKSIAWTTVSLTAQGLMLDGTKLEYDEARVTLIFEKQGGDWLIVHEHGSVALPIPDQDAVRAMLGNETVSEEKGNE